MANEEKIESWIRNLGKATARQIGELMHSRQMVSSIESGDATCRRTLNDLVSRGELKKEGSCYMLPNLNGFGEHDKKLTEVLVMIMKRWDCVVKREHSIEEVGLRPDAIVFITNSHKKGVCVILEVMETEKDKYLKQKVSVWNGWKNACGYLSQLFGYTIPSFLFTTYGKTCEGIYETNYLLVKLNEEEGNG